MDRTTYRQFSIAIHSVSFGLLLYVSYHLYKPRPAIMGTTKQYIRIVTICAIVFNIVWMCYQLANAPEYFGCIVSLLTLVYILMGTMLHIRLLVCLNQIANVPGIFISRFKVCSIVLWLCCASLSCPILVYTLVGQPVPGWMYFVYLNNQWCYYVGGSTYGACVTIYIAIQSSYLAWCLVKLGLDFEKLAGTINPDAIPAVRKLRLLIIASTTCDCLCLLAQLILTVHPAVPSVAQAILDIQKAVLSLHPCFFFHIFLQLRVVTECQLSIKMKSGKSENIINVSSKSVRQASQSDQSVSTSILPKVHHQLELVSRGISATIDE